PTAPLLPYTTLFRSLRGVSYGPFATTTHGFPFPEQTVLERDFTLMAELGANCLRTFTVPPRWLLDRAAEHGLRVLITIPWAEHRSEEHTSELQSLTN